MRLISGPLQRNKKNQSEGDETSEAAEVQNRPFAFGGRAAAAAAGVGGVGGGGRARDHDFASDPTKDSKPTKTTTTTTTLKKKKKEEKEVWRTRESHERKKAHGRGALRTNTSTVVPPLSLFLSLCQS